MLPVIYYCSCTGVFLFRERKRVFLLKRAEKIAFIFQYQSNNTCFFVSICILGTSISTADEGQIRCVRPVSSLLVCLLVSR